MNKEYYTEDNRHPEDVIRETQVFIQELSRVQDMYFTNLVDKLGLNQRGIDMLFDYVYNCGDDGHSSFEEYLKDYSRDSYEDIAHKRVPIEL